MNKEELKQVLADHALWLTGKGGIRAYLTGADLSGADLTGAYLTGAYLTGANLIGAKIGERIVSTVVARITRSDGHEFVAFKTDNGHVIRAGCQTKTLDEYRDHISASYPNTDKARETTRILDYITACLEADKTNG
jgi:uncharacterized protein YjbI with pentapeptide repeats